MDFYTGIKLIDFQFQRNTLCPKVKEQTRFRGYCKKYRTAFNEIWYTYKKMHILIK